MDKFDYDNERDRFSFGYDAGLIIDARVELDKSTGEYILVDDEAKATSTQEVLKQHLGRQIRLTFIPMDSVQKLEDLIASSST